MPRCAFNGGYLVPKPTLRIVRPQQPNTWRERAHEWADKNSCGPDGAARFKRLIDAAYGYATKNTLDSRAELVNALVSLGD